MSFTDWQRERTVRQLETMSAERASVLRMIADIDSGKWTHEGPDETGRWVDCTEEVLGDHKARVARLTAAISIYTAELGMPARGTA